MGLKARTKAVLGLTVAGVAASVLIPATAQASDQNQTICNHSDVSQMYIFQPWDGYQGIGSPVIGPNECWTAWVRDLPRPVDLYKQINGQMQFYGTTEAGGVEFGVV
ncbi:hypothetical protein GCM10010151_11430 [Actinoallomurus spadix]|uniref:Secreted protein n=2 Tax=Actinoallomurus spadix TaxID=79912 RepID=A0ABN0W2G5_9ACTN